MRRKRGDRAKAVLKDSGKSPMVEAAIDAGELHGIGLVTAEWSYAESMMEYLIWQLSSLDIRKGQIVTTHLGSVTRLQMLACLVHEILDEEAEKDLQNEVLDLIELFDGLRTKRNTIVHAFWLMPNYLMLKAKPKAMSVTAKGKLIVQEQVFDPLHSRDVAMQITSWIHMASATSKKLPPIPKVEARLLARQVRKVGQSRDPTQKPSPPQYPPKKK